ncbi:MAG: spermidine synthase, partial [Gemmatimonadales bacterium]
MFAIEHFHHLAYMAVGVAMLGIGASGALVAGLGAPRPPRAEAWLTRAALLTAASLVASPALVHLVPLDATRLAWDVATWPRLALMNALLAVPFASGALVTVLALTLEPERTGRLYGASFAGAGLGALLAVAILWVASPARALAMPAVVAAVGAMAAAGGRQEAGGASGAPLISRLPPPASRVLPWLALAGALLALVHPPWRLTITPYKGLPQVSAYPDARTVGERSSPVGWTAAVDAAAFRFAPGLSLGYRGLFPRQTALFVDGELAGAATWWGETPGAARMLDWLPTALPYATGPARRVLVIGAGGGLEVAGALAHGADHVTAVELSPDVVHFAGTAPSTAAPAGTVRWVVGDARSFVARSRDRFDLIVIGPGGAPGTAAAGVHALDQDFLHTVDAYAAYLDRLDGDGVLAVTRWLTVPPRAPVRVTLTAAEALRRGRTDALDDGRGLVVARSWGTA